MSPTVFIYKNYRFFFFSREEERKHIHIECPDGEAKFWLEPDVELVVSQGLAKKELAALKKVVESRKNEITKSWNNHFGS